MIKILVVSLIKESFIDPKKLLHAKQLKKKPTFLLFFLLSLVLSIPLFTQSLPLLQQLGTDAQAVSQKIPAFIITNNELVLDEPMEKGFIYKTDSVMLTFDLENPYSDEDLERTSKNIMLHLVFSQNEFILYAGGIPLAVPYSQADGMTDKFYKDLLGDFTKSQILSALILFLFCFIVSSIEIALNLLIISLFANVLSSIVQKRQSFSENWKMALIAISIPVLFFAILNSLGFVPYFQEEIIAALALFYYYKAVKDVTPATKA